MIVDPSIYRTSLHAYLNIEISQNSLSNHIHLFPLSPLQSKLTEMVHNMSVFHSVHMEEIDTFLIRKSVLALVESTKLVEVIPTVSEFTDMWTSEVSIVCSVGKKHVRKIKSLKSVVKSLFHDRRGKIATIARSTWSSVFMPPAFDASRSDRSAKSGVHSLIESTSDCWSFVHKRTSNDAGVSLRIVKRGYGITGVSPSSALPESQGPPLESTGSESADVQVDSGINAGNSLATRRLWNVCVTSITSEEYRENYAGSTAIDNEPPFGAVEWTIHPGSVFVFAKVLNSACIAKTEGLVVDVKVGGRSQRIMSVSTNASPKLETFILSMVSNHLNFFIGVVQKFYRGMSVITVCFN